MKSLNQLRYCRFWINTTKPTNKNRMTVSKVLLPLLWKFWNCRKSRPMVANLSVNTVRLTVEVRQWRGILVNPLRQQVRKVPPRIYVLTRVPKLTKKKPTSSPWCTGPWPVKATTALLAICWHSLWDGKSGSARVQTPEASLLLPEDSPTCPQDEAQRHSEAPALKYPRLAPEIYVSCCLPAPF